MEEQVTPPPKTAGRACALLLVGVVSMTVVAVGQRTGDVDRFRTWAAQTAVAPLVAHEPVGAARLSR